MPCSWISQHPETWQYLQKKSPNSVDLDISSLQVIEIFIIKQNCLSLKWVKEFVDIIFINFITLRKIFSRVYSIEHQIQRILIDVTWKKRERLVIVWKCQMKQSKRIIFLHNSLDPLIDKCSLKISKRNHDVVSLRCIYLRKFFP